MHPQIAQHFMLKHELRKNYKSKRTSLHQDELENKSIRLANQLLEIPVWDFFYFHTFLSITKNKEVELLYHFSLLITNGKKTHFRFNSEF